MAARSEVIVISKLVIREFTESVVVGSGRWASASLLVWDGAEDSAREMGKKGIPSY